MANPFGRYSLTNLLFHGGAPISPSNDGGFGRYSLPNVLGRLFHHGQNPQTPVGYDSSGINPGASGNPFGGQSDFTNGFSIGSGSPFDVGNGFLGGRQYDPFTAGNPTPAQHNGDPFSAGNPAPVGGGGVSQTTNGFTTAFRGGGDVYDPADFIRALKIKGGNAIR